MATTATPSPAVTDEARIIDRQLNITRAQVRLVELGGAAVAWIVGLLVFLLGVILIDHWIMPLGSIGRSLALIILAGGSIAYFALVIWPLLRRQINPVYAARAIEESTPSLKNSLINFLLLKKDSSGTKEAILSAVERRAAVDIAAVPVEMAVDRSHVIRLGYVLLAVVCLLALYKIQSPKDPFQTVARVFAPWANIAKPARVTIREVTPGDVGVYHGDVVNVSCSIVGLRAGEAVEVSYSTTDGQVLNQLVPMKAASSGTRYEAQLPATSAERNTATRGVQQDLVYHVRAGDCVTGEYRVTVSPAPTIAVEKIVYDYPAYTNKPLRTVVGQGDIQGLEGTRITLHARANQPIQTATLEFDPGDGSKMAPESLPLKVEGDLATVSFPLQLQPDQQTPWRSTYQVRFYNTTGSRNPQPIVHRIDVTADMPPEIEWLAPRQMKIEVPADGQQRLELRAVDPDFGLRAIRLQAQRGDQQLFNQSLLPATPASPPQATVPYDFIPSAWKLEEGDEVVVWGVAEDGRVSPLKQTGEPNTAKTEPLVIRITAPAAPEGNAGQPKPPNAPKQPNDPQNPNDQKQPNQDQPNKQPKPGANDPQQEQQPQDNKPPMAGEQPPKQQPKPGEEQPKENGGEQSEEPKNSQKPNKSKKPEEQQNENGGEEGGEGQKGGSKKGEQKEPMAGEAGDEKNQGGGSEGGEPSGAPQTGGGGGQEGGSSNDQPMDSGSQGGEGQQGGSEGGSSAEGGEGSGQDSGKPSGKNQNGQNGGKQPQTGGAAGEGDPAGGESQGDPSGAPNSQNSGEGGKGQSSNKPEHDGDVFDKVLDRLKNDPNHPKNNNAQGKPDGERPAGDQKPEDGKAEEGESRPPREGEQNADNKSEQGKSNQKNGSGQPKGNEQGKSGDPASPQPGKEGKSGEGRQPEKQPESPMNGGQEGGSKNEGEGNSGQKKEGQPNGTGNSQQPPETKNEGAAKKPEEQGAAGGAANKKPELEEKKHVDGDQQNANPGEGGATQRNPRQPSDNPQSQGGQKGTPKDPGAGDNGQSGKGQNSDEKSGSANDQNEQQNQDRPKTGSADNGDGQKGEASPPGQSKKSSNSQGGESGDQKGGGKKGGGQSAGGAGNDSAGKNNAADQGAGKANEQGEGESGTQAGDQEKADGKTGKSSENQKGEGSKSGQPPSGEKNQEGQSKDPGQGSPSEQTPNSTNGGDGGKGGKRGHVVGGGKAADGNTAEQAPAPAGNVADGDEANLDYARRATDLVIDHLEDQEHNPDPELLKELGWTQQDLQRFVQRWKALKESSTEKPAEKQELDESLRSLGLRAPKDKQRSGGTSDDHLRDIRDTGGRTSPPNRYRDQFEAFRKGVGR